MLHVTIFFTFANRIKIAVNNNYDCNIYDIQHTYYDLRIICHCNVNQSLLNIKHLGKIKPN